MGGASKAEQHYRGTGSAVGAFGTWLQGASLQSKGENKTYDNTNHGSKISEAPRGDE
jgi:hypothetical protein